MSEEIALTSSPNFFRASPVSETETGSGFLLVVGLIIKKKLETAMSVIMFLFFHELNDSPRK